MAELTYRDAVARGIAQEMERDEDVVFLGEDIAKAGGVFKATAGLLEKFGELRVPSTKGPYPLAIVIHGGCWVAKLPALDPNAVAMDNMRPMATALNDAGIATWNIEYRRLGNQGGGWPGTFRDVATAADFIRTIATERQLDLTRVISIGHSAGAHFALWLAARPKLSKNSEVYASDPLHVTGVVSLDGPADLKATIPLQQPVCGSPVITDLIGGSPEERPDRYRDASPIEQLPLGVPQVAGAVGVQIQVKPESTNGNASCTRALVASLGPWLLTVTV